MYCCVNVNVMLFDCVTGRYVCVQHHYMWCVPALFYSHGGYMCPIVKCVLCHHFGHLLLLLMQVATEQLSSSASSFWGKPLLLSILYIASTRGTNVHVRTMSCHMCGS